MCNCSDQMIKINWKKSNQDAIIPTYGTDGAACFDLSSIHDGIVPAKGSCIVDTGLSMELRYACTNKLIENGWVMRIYPRSGMGFKHDIILHIGNVDVDYRDNIKVKIFNFSDKDYEFKAGDRIAQGSVERVYQTIHNEVNELSDTKRGKGGFGSTGK